ncbi:Uma2 family endonuclease [Rhodopirellula bahusiensis]|uniref:Putative restriction endonuclease domain-containing protein n=1 Tax=Rhodopirellula bahusiensis TaxID=2014065 RepID=A0A2G1WAA4_9BACT|nr:Uma2 family endonuclease [Rhodopirellula bahusiensis]PHQ35972.1 hypothetical protein CEE69_07155 [Rhodopirellula bahusiensis]
MRAFSDAVLAMEVSDSSLQYDLSETANLYAEAGLSVHWVVNVPNQQLHVMRAPTRSRYTQLASFKIGDSTSPSIQPAAILDLKDLFEGE